MIIRFLKWVGLGILVTLGIVAATLFFMSEKEPMGNSGQAADELAQKMMEAVNAEAWDSLRFISWKARTGFEYIWDKETNQVQCALGAYKVVLHTQTQKGAVWKNGTPINGEEAKSQIDKAWFLFCNDSFWLNPIVKAFDPGTQRSIVTLNDGRKGLKVKYKSGGVTPGDAYVWVLDESNLPVACKMWVKILPIGGLEFSWENWVKVDGGATLATDHTVFGQKFKAITNLKSGMTFQELNLPDEPIANAIQ